MIGKGWLKIEYSEDVEGEDWSAENGASQENVFSKATKRTKITRKAGWSKMQKQQATTNEDSSEDDSLDNSDAEEEPEYAGSISSNNNSDDGY